MKPSRQNQKFDMSKPPVRQRWFLRPLTWAASYPDLLLHRLKINRSGLDNYKPPYLLLCNHMAFIDFKVTTAAIFPHRANYVVAIDGFIGREWLLRNAGGICKRKFTNDLTLITQIRRVIENGDILVLYPEARYCHIGTNSALPDSLGKMVRLLGVPVATLTMHGNYLNSPCWNLKKRGVPLAADFTGIISAEESQQLSIDELNARIRQALVYDEYRWQKDNNIQIKAPNSAEGLQKVLYQCPNCKTEHKMGTQGNRIWCGHCSKEWNLTPLGELKATRGETEFSHPPDWYEFQRREVRSQIEAGTYRFSDEVEVDSLPSAQGYIPLGQGRLTHTMDGFTLEVETPQGPLCLTKNPASMIACHVEYQYGKRKRDCIDLSTLSDTYYIYPLNIPNCVTKIALATEELHDYWQRQKQRKEQHAR